MHGTGVIRQINRAGAALVIAATAVFFTGCRDKVSSESVQPQSTAEVTEPPSAAASPSPETTAKPARELTATVDASGRKWLSPTVPYDVFSGLPSDREIATASAAPSPVPTMPPVGDPAPQDGTMVAATERASPAPSPMPTPMPTEPAEPPQGSPMPAAGDWGSLLPLESLQNEIATVKNDLAEKLLTVGSYNAAFEQVSQDGWVLSALATIASEHPAAISWKGDALLARDAAVSVAMAATARGRQNFGEAQLANEQLAGVLNNNTPAGLPSPDPATSREETADRAALMARMQVAFDRLKESGADEASFKTNRAASGHEAHVLAAFAKFTAHSDYGSAEEPVYQAAASELLAAATAMASAAEAEDPAAFKTALDTVGTSCNKCHEKYRFEN